MKCHVTVADLLVENSDSEARVLTFVRLRISLQKVMGWKLYFFRRKNKNMQTCTDLFQTAYDIHFIFRVQPT